MKKVGWGRGETGEKEVTTERKKVGWGRGEKEGKKVQEECKG